MKMHQGSGPAAPRDGAWSLRRVPAILAIMAPLALGQAARADGTLFIGSDEGTFSGTVSDFGRYTTSGATVTGGVNIPVSYDLNGLGEGNGFLYAGNPDDNTLNKIDYSGNILSTVTAGVPIGQFNEDYAGNGTDLYHAFFGNSTSGEIDHLDLTTGALLDSHQLPFGAVGITFVGSTLWITNWSTHEVGTFDLATDAFTPVFTTPNDAGALAYDPTSGVLWVGQDNGGFVLPCSTTGTSLGAGFQPFGDIADTIDGLAFVPAPVPEPSALILAGLGGVTLLGFARRRRGAIGPVR